MRMLRRVSENECKEFYKNVILSLCFNWIYSFTSLKISCSNILLEAHKMFSCGSSLICLNLTLPDESIKILKGVTMNIHTEYSDAFTQLGAIYRAWAAATKEIVSENLLGKEPNTKDFVSQQNRLEDSETLAAFGYVINKGEYSIMQADIVNTLAPDCEQERQKVRQDIKRRVDALEFFGLVERKYLTKTALQLVVTEAGKSFRTSFDEHFAKENN